MNIDNLIILIIIVSLTLPILIAFNIFKMFGINISTIIISTVIFILLQILCFISLLMGVLHFENNICLGAVD